MIRNKLFQTGISFALEDAELCERVFNRLRTAKQIVLEIHREELADKIIWAFRHGVRDEKDFIRLME